MYDTKLPHFNITNESDIQLCSPGKEAVLRSRKLASPLFDDNEETEVNNKSNDHYNYGT